MRPHGSPLHLYRRRQRAVRLLRQGSTLSAVARQVGASAGSVFEWWRQYKLRKEAGIAPVPAPGRPRKLTPAQEQTLAHVLQKEFDALVAKLAGGVGDLPYSKKRLITSSVSQIINEFGREFEVTYHEGHVGRVLRRWGWNN